MLQLLALALLVSPPALPLGATEVTVALGKSTPCPIPTNYSICDDINIVEPQLDKDDLLKATFVAKKLGETTCACGPVRGLRSVLVVRVVPLIQTLQPLIDSLSNSAAEGALSFL